MGTDVVDGMNAAVQVDQKDLFVIYFHRYNPDDEQPVMDEGGKAITNTYLYEGRPRMD